MTVETKYKITAIIMSILAIGVILVEIYYPTDITARILACICVVIAFVYDIILCSRLIITKNGDNNT